MTQNNRTPSDLLPLRSPAERLPGSKRSVAPEAGRARLKAERVGPGGVPSGGGDNMAAKSAWRT